MYFGGLPKRGDRPSREKFCFRSGRSICSETSHDILDMALDAKWRGNSIPPAIQVRLYCASVSRTALTKAYQRLSAVLA
jgi:hypothetical protein